MAFAVELVVLFMLTRFKSGEFEGVLQDWRADTLWGYLDVDLFVGGKHKDSEQ